MSKSDRVQSSRRPPLSLYLHIPFCRHRCAYCDFNTYTSLGDLKDEYAAALCREIGLVAGDARRPVRTIFFGGGTPSLMSPQSLALILQAVAGRFDLDHPVEITLEANPDTVDDSYLTALRGLGINRLSFGAQSAVAAELALLEREHDFAAVVEAIGLSRAAGFDNINLDLIYGLPGQSLDDWAYSLRAVLDLAPEHLSLYCLIIEPGTPMQRWLDSGRIELPDPDLAAEQYDLACQMLDQQGFSHYEISNWSRPGRECAHNLVYWRNQEYLGFGAGAHGHAAGYRYSLVRQPRVYIRRVNSGQSAAYPISPAAADTYILTPAEAMADTVITQLRLLDEGLDLSAFANHFGRALHKVFPGVVESLVEWGLVAEVGDHLRLTRRGWFLSNQVFFRFMQPD